MKISFRYWDFFKVMLPTLLIVMAAFYVAYQFVGPPPPSTITMIVGSPDGKYWEFAEHYQEELAKNGITLNLLESKGSIENYEKLQDREQNIDLAFLQSGIGETTEENRLFGLASVAYEPVWVFYHRENEINRVGDLIGKRIAIGPEGSGSRPVALTVLESNGISMENTELLPISAGDAAAELKSGAIDAAFMVAAPTSGLIADFLASPSLAVMEFERHNAYKQRHSYLSSVLLSEGLLDLAENRPEKDKMLISCTATIAARQELHPALVDLLMQVSQEVHEEGGLLEEKDEFPSPRYMSLDLSPEAKRYFKYGPPLFQRFMPFWVANLLDRLKVMIIPFLTILIPLFKIFPPTYRWKIRSKIYKWYGEIDEIEKEAIATESIDEIVKLAKNLRDIDRQISKIKVPLSYAYEAYSLRVHLDLILQKVKRRGKQIKEDTLEQDDDVDPIV